MEKSTTKGELTGIIDRLEKKVCAAEVPPEDRRSFHSAYASR